MPHTVRRIGVIMKKYTMAAAVFAASLLLCSCGDGAPAENGNTQSAVAQITGVSVPAQETEKPAETAVIDPSDKHGSTDAEITASETVSEADIPEPEVTGTPDEEFDSDSLCARFDGSSMDFYLFNPEEDGHYSFEHSGESGADWMIFVLDEKFTDGLRYLFSNYKPTAMSNAELDLKKGSYVYCLCSVNEWNSAEPPDAFLSIYKTEGGSDANDDSEDIDPDSASDDAEEMKDIAGQLFEDACETQWDYFCSSDTLFDLDYDITPEDESGNYEYFYKINNVDTYGEAITEYFEVFSNLYHQNDLSSVLYSDDNGVYISNGARGMDITYVGSEITSVDFISESSAEFTVTNTYTDRVESTEFSLIYERGTWRVGKFTLPY